MRFPLQLLGILSLGWVIGQYAVVEVSAVMILAAVGGVLCLVLADLRPSPPRVRRVPTEPTDTGLAVVSMSSFVVCLVVLGLSLSLWLLPAREIRTGGDAHAVQGGSLNPPWVQLRARQDQAWLFVRPRWDQTDEKSRIGADRFWWRDEAAVRAWYERGRQ